ncbi:MAG: DinB family protein [Reichenbachiella sp.]
MNRQIISSISDQLELILQGSPWIYDTYKIKFVYVTERNAFIRPLPTLHSVAEIVWHLTNWRTTIIDRACNGNPRKVEKEWSENEELKRIGWDKLLETFMHSCQVLKSILASKNDDFLEEKYFDPDYNEEKNFQFLIEGLLHHDLYHMGQIGIIIKLLKEGKN